MGYTIHMYTCPMHPQIRQKLPGVCPLCAMKLVKDNEFKIAPAVKENKDSYVPLIVIFLLLIVITLSFSFKEGSFSLTKSISYFMTGFFLVFSGFKLMDLHGFAEGYAQYDLIAKKITAYGYVYPFIELFFGLSMILFPLSRNILLVEGIVMSISGIGVIVKLMKKEKFQCACLGTFLKVPLTKVTLFEDFGMAALAFFLLIFS